MDGPEQRRLFDLGGAEFMFDSASATAVVMNSFSWIGIVGKSRTGNPERRLGSTDRQALRFTVRRTITPAAGRTPGDVIRCGKSLPPAAWYFSRCRTATIDAGSSLAASNATNRRQTPQAVERNLRKSRNRPGPSARHRARCGRNSSFARQLPARFSWPWRSRAWSDRRGEDWMVHVNLDVMATATHAALTFLPPFHVWVTVLGAGPTRGSGRRSGHRESDRRDRSP